MKLLCLVPDGNTPGKKDVTGAFHPEAVALAKQLGVDPAAAIRRFPAKASLPQRRAVCTRMLEEARDLEVLAVFCHGWRNGLQAGYQLAQVRTLARLVAEHMVERAHVVLFACEAGRDADADSTDDREPGPGGDGGFADELRDACESLGRQVTVMGHTTAGHCTQNPYARRFAPGCMGRGGEWFVEPRSALWGRWVRALREPGGTLRLRFWGMTSEEIADELRPGGGPPLVA